MGTWCSSHSFCCPSKMSHFSCGIGFIIFNFDLTRLPTWAVAWLFGWCQEIPLGILSLKGDAVWTPGTVCFFTSVCFCLCIKGSERVWNNKVCSDWLVCVGYLYLCVNVCVWKGDRVGVRETVMGRMCFMRCDNSVRYVVFLGTPYPRDMHQ